MMQWVSRILYGFMLGMEFNVPSLLEFNKYILMYADLFLKRGSPKSDFKAKMRKMI